MDGLTSIAWIAIFATLTAALLIDLILFERLRTHGRPIAARNLSLGMWAILAVSYGISIAVLLGPSHAWEFYRGIALEGVLSVDNIVLLFVCAAVVNPKGDRLHRLLLLGCLASLFIRSVFVIVGFSALQSASWLPAALGAVLLVLGLKGILSLLRPAQSASATTSPMAWMRRLPPLRGIGPFLILIAGLEGLNSLLSLDSLSALLVTSDRPFIVFAASMFGTILLRNTARFSSWFQANQDRLAKAAPWLLAITGLGLVMPNIFPSWASTLLMVLALVVSLSESAWQRQRNRSVLSLVPRNQ